MPIEARTVILAGTISLILLLIIFLDICSSRCLALLQDGLSAVVSTVGLPFVVVNVKDYQRNVE